MGKREEVDEVCITGAVKGGEGGGGRLVVVGVQTGREPGMSVVYKSDCNFEVRNTWVIAVLVHTRKIPLCYR